MSYKLINKKSFQTISYDLIPRSKSYTNRLLILYSLMKNECEIQNPSNSSDTIELITALKVIGVEVLEMNYPSKRLVIINSFPECEREEEIHTVTLPMMNGGTSFRFLLALLSLGRKKYKISLSLSLKSRPNQDLYQALRCLGADVKIKGDEVFIQGPLRKNEVSFDSKSSSQFYSALKIISNKYPINLKTHGLNLNYPYVKLTDFLAESCKNATRFCVPIDISSMAYNLALEFGSCLSDEQLQRLMGQCFDPYQADSEIFNILISWKREQISGKYRLYGDYLFDARKYPDLIPTICFLASLNRGQTEIVNMDYLVYKESNRFLEIIKLMNLFELEIRSSKKNLLIKSAGEYFTHSKDLENKLEYLSPDDHRMAMTSALFFNETGGKIYNFDVVRKSYPNFYDNFLTRPSSL